MEQRTHHAIDARLVGRPVELAAGRARVELVALAEMAADERGLVHGGFTFGLADYAAMLAVNEPTVVIGGAQLKFIAPVVVGDVIVADATVERAEGKKRLVRVVVAKDGAPVLEGELTCFVPDGHVLDRRR